jgi:hypothetical protein
LPEGRILVGTDQGQLILCEQNGEYRKVLNDGNNGEGFYIEKFLVYKRGFIISGDFGQMKVYANIGEPQNPYQLIASLPDRENTGKISQEQLDVIASLHNSRIKSMDLSHDEDALIFTTDQNQIYKMGISLVDTKNVETAYEYLVHQFHSRLI